VLRRVRDDGPAVVVLEDPGERAGGLWVDLAALLGRAVGRPVADAELGPTQAPADALLLSTLGDAQLTSCSRNPGELTGVEAVAASRVATWSQAAMSSDSSAAHVPGDDHATKARAGKPSSPAGSTRATRIAHGSPVVDSKRTHPTGTVTIVAGISIGKVFWFSFHQPRHVFRTA